MSCFSKSVRVFTKVLFTAVVVAGVVATGFAQITVSNVSVIPTSFDPTLGYCLVQYNLSANASSVNVEIFDSSSTRVRLIASTSAVVGQNFVSWDGKNDSDASVSGGDYVVKVTAQLSATTWAGTATKPVTMGMGIATNKNTGSASLGKVYVARRTNNSITDGTAAAAGGWAWVSSTWSFSSGTYADGTVEMFTVTGGTNIASVGTFTRPDPAFDDAGPVKVSVDADDYVYVGDWYQFGYPATDAPAGRTKNTRIWRFNADGTSPTVMVDNVSNGLNIVTLGFEVRGTGSNKVLWTVAREGAGKVYYFDQFNGTKWTDTAPKSINIDGICGADITFDNAGAMYVCFGDPHAAAVYSLTDTSYALVKYSSATKVWALTFAQLGGLKNVNYGATGVEYNVKDGNIYVDNGGYIAIVDTNGNVLDQSSFNTYGAHDLCTDANGYVYVVNRATYQVSNANTGGWWKIRTSSTTTHSSSAQGAVSVGSVSTAVDTSKVTVTQNAPGTQDTITGTAGAATAGASVKLYSDSGLTTMIGQATATGDGSFGPVNIGDGYPGGTGYGTVYINQTESGKVASAAVNVTNDIEPPATAPTGLGLSVSSAGTGLTLSWTALSGAASYNVYRNNTSISTIASLTKLNASAVTGNSYTDTTVNGGTLYYYVVTGVDAYGNEQKNVLPAAISGMLVNQNTATSIEVSDPGSIVTKIDIESGDLATGYSVSISTFASTSVTTANNNARDDLNIQLPNTAYSSMPIREIKFKDSTGATVSSPVSSGQKVKLTIGYSTAYLNAYTLQGLSEFGEEKLRLFKLNTTNNTWELVSNSAVTAASDIVSAEMSGFSIFTVMPWYSSSTGSNDTPQTKLTNANVYPNPYTKADSAAAKSIVFCKLTDRCDIYVYDVSGTLFYKIAKSDTSVGSYSWDGKDSKGNEIGPGLFIAVMKKGSDTKVVKFAVNK
ncbi:MAG: FlgD immunoglobulin-like domain containing protein [Elusimicrobiota bacterium]